MPSPRSQHPRGRRVRREPDSRRDDRRRGRPARPRRDQHDVERQPGDGPRRRGGLPDVADRAQDARRARARLPASAATTTTCASAATSPSTRSTRPSRTAWRTRSDRSRSGKLADLVLWKPAFFGVEAGAGAEGRLHRLGADGRSECVDPDAAAARHAADVRRLRPGDRRDVAGVRVAALARAGVVAAIRADASGSLPSAAAAASASAT